MAQGIDKVLMYRSATAGGRLSPHGVAALQPGAGPRHLDFHPNGRYVYVINELDATLAVFSHVAESGMLTRLQTLSTLPEGYVGPKSGAESARIPLECLCMLPTAATIALPSTP